MRGGVAMNRARRLVGLIVLLLSVAAVEGIAQQSADQSAGTPQGESSSKGSDVSELDVTRFRSQQFEYGANGETVFAASPKTTTHVSDYHFGTAVRWAADVLFAPDAAQERTFVYAYSANLCNQNQHTIVDALADTADEDAPGWGLMNSQLVTEIQEHRLEHVPITTFKVNRLSNRQAFERVITTACDGSETSGSYWILTDSALPEITPDARFVGDHVM